MKREKWRQFLSRVIKDPRSRDIGLYAASGAYYLFLSLGPLVALILSVLPYTAVSQQQLLEALLPYAPTALGEIIYNIVTDVYAGSLTALGLSLAAELWSAGKFLSGVVGGVGAIVDGADEGFFRRRIMGALYTMALIGFILANLTLLLFGERFLVWIRSSAPAVERVGSFLLRQRAALFFVGLTAVNALLFRYAPRKELKLLKQMPGAAFSAGAWLAFTRGYSFALERFGLFGVYGSIAAVIISLFWMYCSLYILFLGVWLNTLFDGTWGDRQ